MLKKYFFKSLQTALNYALTMDEMSQNKLQELSGSVLQLVISPLQLNVFICFSEKLIQILPDYAGSVDTVIYSSPVGLINLSMTPAAKIRSLFNDQITITGNLELGQKVKKFMDELNLDWEGQLAKFTGDVVAYQIGDVVRKCQDVKQQVSESLEDNITDFLQEECQVLPSAEELQDFFNDVDELSLRADRLLAQFAILGNNS